MLDKSMVVVILQARTTSERLPGKVLLPLAGIPLVCLAALRASNTGLSTIVATSTDSTDDRLVETLINYNLSFDRGSLKDVFQRFESVLAPFSDETIVVRLTGDNVFPDGEFIESAINFLVEKNLLYLRSDMNVMPYGLSVEVFIKKAFLEQKSSNLTEYDREHVTPGIRVSQGDHLFQSRNYAGPGLRCTIDYPKDYSKIFKIFSHIQDPINASVPDLIQALNLARICLGTVQLGLKYGINNLSEQPALAEALGILGFAKNKGIRLLDTANAYGTSELVIGKFNAQNKNSFEIITKIAPALDESSLVAFQNSLRNSIESSLEKLQLTVLSTVLFHRVEHAFLFDGAGVNILKEFQRQGVIHHLGVSVSNPEELKLCLAKDWIEHIQLPFNILDSRWQGCEVLLKAASHRVTFHTRSVFLQGLFFLKDVEKWPNNVQESYAQIQKYIQTLENKFQIDFKSIALAYCLQKDWIDSLVVGVDNFEQLDNLVQTLEKVVLLTSEDLLFIESQKPQLADKVLDPSQWRFS